MEAYESIASRAKMVSRDSAKLPTLQLKAQGREVPSSLWWLSTDVSHTLSVQDKNIPQVSAAALTAD